MRSGFFNSEIIGYDAENMPVFDRAEEASFFAKYFSQFISNGVFPNPSTNMQVLATEGMQVKVSIGVCYINGYMGWVEPVETLEIEESDLQARIDRIVARLDFSDRSIKLFVKKGNPLGNPVAPTLQRDYDIYEIGLADVRVNANAIEITQENITDLRLNTELCGIVANHLQHLDTTTLFNQYQDWLNRVTNEAETDLAEKKQEMETRFNNIIAGFSQNFDEWFQDVQTTLSGDVAGNLLVKINNIDERVNAKSEELKTDYTNKINNLRQIVVASNTGAHNAIYRGEDITDLFYNGTLSQQIANGTFDDIFIGDYIIGQTSGRKYLVADINYRLNKYVTKKPHVLMIPEKIMGKSKMNNDMASTDGAYGESDMRITNLTPYREIIKNDFGVEHILEHENYFQNVVTNGYETEGKFYKKLEIELMNEIMVYGSNIYKNCMNGGNLSDNKTMDKSQLALFRYRHDLIIALNDEEEPDSYWLRDVCSSMDYAFVINSGIASNYIASNLGGVRPYFLIY